MLGGERKPLGQLKELDPKIILDVATGTARCCHYDNKDPGARKDHWNRYK